MEFSMAVPYYWPPRLSWPVEIGTISVQFFPYNSKFDL